MHFSDQGLCDLCVCSRTQQLVVDDDVMVMMMILFFAWPRALIHNNKSATKAHTHTHTKSDKWPHQGGFSVIVCRLLSDMFLRTDPSSWDFSCLTLWMVQHQDSTWLYNPVRGDSTHTARPLSPRTDINDNVHRVCRQCSYTHRIKGPDFFSFFFEFFHKDETKAATKSFQITEPEAFFR